MPRTLILDALAMAVGRRQRSAEFQLVAHADRRSQYTASTTPRPSTTTAFSRRSEAQKARVGGRVQLTVRVKPALKARKGRNAATGEEITIAAKPAVLILARARWQRPSPRCRQYRKRADDSPPETCPLSGPDSEPNRLRDRWP